MPQNSSKTAPMRKLRALIRLQRSNPNIILTPTQQEAIRQFREEERSRIRGYRLAKSKMLAKKQKFTSLSNASKNAEHFLDSTAASEPFFVYADLDDTELVKEDGFSEINCIESIHYWLSATLNQTDSSTQTDKHSMRESICSVMDSMENFTIFESEWFRLM
ncbi:hypothetical protein V1512DRAFT_255542 [Lipomyces arxii]|uniref:uncharacterized protein n=1 Tax=Lipomyces arxii TaxID=56418 RepID=UPI0034CF4672